MLGRTILVSVLLITGSLLIGRAARPEPVALPIPLARFPAQIGEWQGVQQPALDKQSREVLGVDDYLDVGFLAANGSTVGLFVGYWNSQQQGDTIHSPLNCLPGAGWEPLSKRAIVVHLSQGRGTQPSAVTVNRYVVKKGLERQMILYWYQSHGRAVASEYWSKFFLVASAIRTGQTDAAFVRVNTPIMGEQLEDEIVAEERASRFVQEVFPVLDRHLPG